jgi:rare lipoprotein A
LLTACGTSPPKPSPSAPAATPPSGSSRYYKDDGPGEAPSNLDEIPDASPRLEPLNRFANRPYSVLGQDYVPATTLRPYKERGVASWYGRKFHGQKTSNGETYDMFAMTAAHPTLPLPSYAKVTNLTTGKSVVVRVNDRGPFLHGRIIDLSYAAAHRVGIAAPGSGEVEVEAIIPGESPTLAAAAPLPPIARIPTPATPAVVTASAATPSVASGFSVQLGAFQNNVNAQNFLAHVQTQLAAASVEPKVREANGLYRVYVGPYPYRDEARRVADRITSAFGFATSVAPH